MPSSTDTGPNAWLEAARDTRHLLAFRARTVRRRGAAFLGLAVVLVLTAVFAVVPSRVDLRSGGSAPFERAVAALEGNLGAAFAGFLLLAVGAAMGSGGGRELLSRSEAADPPDQPAHRAPRRARCSPRSTSPGWCRRGACWPSPLW